MAVTADELLTGIKSRIVYPSSQPLFNDTNVLKFADDSIKSKLVPLLKSVNQDYFVRTSRTALVPQQRFYKIPYRALGRTLRDLKLVDSGGNRRDMSLIALEDEHMFRAGSLPEGFFFKGDEIGIVPTPIVDDYALEFWWELPPGKLTQVANCGTVVSFTTTDVTVQSAPSDIAIGDKVDFIAGESGCATLSFDAVVQNLAAATYTFSLDVIPEDLQQGDYVAPALYAPVIQLPDECYPFLETCLAVRILKSLSDFEGARELEEQRKEEEKDLLKMLEPRITGENTVIINRKGVLRGFRGRFLTSRYFY